MGDADTGKGDVEEGEITDEKDWRQHQETENDRLWTM